MTSSDKQVYEEPEVVGEKTSPHSHKDPTMADVLGGFAQEGAQNVSNQMWWTGLWSLFIFLLIAFVVVGIILTILFWLLPFAVAAFVVAIVVLGVIGLGRAFANFLKK